MTIPTATHDTVAALSRELTELLTDVSVALHKYGMYPDGHPLLESAVAGVGRRLAKQLAGRAELSVGVARRQLMIDGAASDRGNAVLRDLAARLFRREIGTIRFTEGVTDEELTAALKYIGREPERGRTTPTVAGEWPHIALSPLTYDQLRLSDEGPSAPPAERESWATQLWQRLARSALVGDTGEGVAVPDEPRALARLFEGRTPDASFAQKVFQFFRELSGEIRQTGGTAAQALSVRVSELVRSLSPAALERLLRLGGDSRQRRELLRSANQALPVDAVLDMARVVASSSNHTMSEALLLLLAKLAKHADGGTQHAPAGGR